MDNLWIWLVVEPTPLKNMKVSWDDEFHNIWKNKFNVTNHQCSSIVDPKKSAPSQCFFFAKLCGGEKNNRPTI